MTQRNLHCTASVEFIASLVLAALALTACTNGERAQPLVTDGSPELVVMDFRQPLAIDPPPAGWRHRTFFFTDPMEVDFVDKEGRPAIRLATDNSASMLFRYTDIPIGEYPVLSWGWLVETPIDSDIDETTAAGDDHPARIFLTFRTDEGEDHSIELIWGNRGLRAGDWKYLEADPGELGFPHYVVRGGQANVGQWHDEKIDLRKLYAKHWGDPAGLRLIEVALFCDTDATGAESLAYFSNVQVERGDASQNLPPYDDARPGSSG